MATIKIPKAAEPLLKYCRPTVNKMENVCFETYAEYVIFSACLGFFHAERDGNYRVTEFVEQPYPIDMMIFQNQNLYPIILLISIAATKGHQVTTDDDMMARIIEYYSEIGSQYLCELLKQTVPGSFHLELAKLLTDEAYNRDRKGSEYGN